MCDTAVEKDKKNCLKSGSLGTSLVAPSAVFLTEAKRATSLFVVTPNYSGESAMVADGWTALACCRQGLAH